MQRDRTTYSIDCTGVPERDTLTTGDLGEQQQPTRTTAVSDTEGVTTMRQGRTTCKGVYNGETGRNTYTRGVMQRNDATKRQILEAVRIRRTEEGQRMNSRGEWGSNRIPRIEITRE